MKQRVRRQINIPIYWLVVGLMIMVASPLGSFYASTQIAKNNARRIVAEQAKARDAAQAEAREEARRLTCAFLAASLDVYLETPPISAAGRGLRQTYLDFYRAAECKPLRTE